MMLVALKEADIRNFFQLSRNPFFGRFFKALVVSFKPIGTNVRILFYNIMMMMMMMMMIIIIIIIMIIMLVRYVVVCTKPPYILPILTGHRNSPNFRGGKAAHPATDWRHAHLGRAITPKPWLRREKITNFGCFVVVGKE